MYRTTGSRAFALFGMAAAIAIVLAAFHIAGAANERKSSAAFLKDATEVTANVTDYQVQSNSCDSSSAGNRTVCWSPFYTVTYEANGNPETAQVSTPQVSHNDPKPLRPATLQIYYKNDQPSVAESAAELSNDSDLVNQYVVSLVIGLVFVVLLGAWVIVQRRGRPKMSRRDREAAAIKRGLAESGISEDQLG